MTQSAAPAARGAPLSPSQLAVLRGMLEQQRRFRLDQLREMERSDQLGLLSGSNHEISASLLAGAKAALHDVEAAIRRMADGCYGVCTNCGTDLAIERLEVLPQVSLCMPCQRDAQSDD